MAEAGYERVLASAELPLPEPTRGSGPAWQDELLSPAIREVEVGDRRVLVTRLASGEVVAFAKACPHLGTPLRRASLLGDGIRCPQHRYVYDPRTGANLHPADEVAPARLRELRPGFLPTYPAVEHDGWVWISEVPNPPPAD